MAATIYVTPKITKQGEKVYVGLGGFTPGATVTPEFQNYGVLPSVTMNPLGSNGFIMTVPNLVNGSYTLRVTGSDGRTASMTMTINNTASSDVAVMIFHTYTLPKYYYSAPNTRTTFALDIINIGRVPGTAILSVCGYTCTTYTAVTLNPGQTQSFTGLSRSAGTSNANSYSITTRSANQTSGVTDYLIFPFYNTIPATGDGAYYPQQRSALATLGDPVVYTQPATTNPCPTGYHYDMVNGHCISDVGGSCLDCGVDDSSGGGGGGSILDWFYGTTYGVPNALIVGGAVAIPVVLGAVKKKGSKKLF